MVENERNKILKKYKKSIDFEKEKYDYLGMKNEDYSTTERPRDNIALLSQNVNPAAEKYQILGWL